MYPVQGGSPSGGFGGAGFGSTGTGFGGSGSNRSYGQASGSPAAWASAGRRPEDDAVDPGKSWLAMRNPQEKVSQTHFLSFSLIVLFGGLSMSLLMYSIISPYWFMMHSRAYTKDPEVRVLGLTKLVEASDPVKLNVTKTFPSYNLDLRRRVVCAGLKGHNYKKPNAPCGIDCEDKDLLGQVRVRCEKGGHRKTPYEIPIPQPKSIERVRGIELNGMHAIDVLEYGCDKEKTKCGGLLGIKCNEGYRCCSKDVRAQDKYRCPHPTKPNKTRSQALCCLDESIKKLGQTLFNQSKPPTYVALYGWAKWQIKILRDMQDTKKEVTEDGEHWCTVHELRCRTLTEFVDNGWWCCMFLTVSVILITCALAFAMLSFRQKNVFVVGLLFFLGGVVASVTIHNYYWRTAEAVNRTMTPRDKFNRPWIHPMDQYDDENRTIFKNKHAYELAEWTYLRLNARVDFATADLDYPGPFKELWGYTLGKFGAFMSIVAGFACVELHLSLKAMSPSSQIVKHAGTVLLCIPNCCKKFIDDKVAPYPVLFVYPWQKLYPYAFVCGSCGFAVTVIWDWLLMTPVHLIRAVWDYVSCQDICSPQEKRALLAHGVVNDRLQSLLASRRSYFVCMAVLGVVAFATNTVDTVNISNDLTHFYRASNVQTQYPLYRCDITRGNCSTNEIDFDSAKRYSEDMLVRLVAILWEGTNRADTVKHVISWLGTFLSVFCSIGALVHWTDFRKSRRFCIVGWIFASLSPIVTSSIAEIDFVRWDRVEDHVATVGAEIAEEVMFHVTNHASVESCKASVAAIDTGLPIAQNICGWYTWKWNIFKSEEYVRGCDHFEAAVVTYKATLITNSSTFCRKMDLFQSDGPSFRGQLQDKMRRTITPVIKDGLLLAVAFKSTITNLLSLLGAIMSMAPALMQGGLMVKNQVPQQTMPAILTTLPWAFSLMTWAQYQAYYQVLGSRFFLVACLCLSYGPILYYFFAKQYNVIQPMCDQQSVTFTFRIWYYALFLAILFPYILVAAYFGVIDEGTELGYIKHRAITKLFSPELRDVVNVISNSICMYAYTLQAGIDWFVDELVGHHLAAHAPLCLAASQSPEEATVLQKMLDTSLDQEQIDEGTYVCGGLSDPFPTRPSADGTWSDKVKVYTSCLAYKDFATLDQMAGHLRDDDKLPMVLARARRPYWRMMSRPPDGAFVNDCDGGRIVGKKPPHAAEHAADGPGGPGDSNALAAKPPSSSQHLVMPEAPPARLDAAAAVPGPLRRDAPWPGPGGGVPAPPALSQSGAPAPAKRLGEAAF